VSAPAVVSRAIALACLAAFIGGVYLVVAMSLGSVLDDRTSTWVSITATAVVAVLFSRVRERAQRLANRLVYGARASPYETLAELSERVAHAYPTEDVLPQMARILGQGSGALSARVWLRMGRSLVPAAAWPGGTALAPVAIDGDELPPLPESHFGVPVRYRDQLIGALTVTQAPTQPLSPVDLQLLDDLASQAGLVLRNVRLAAELAASLEELSAQAEELRASRQRIVMTQDEERRQVERDIHDGAQQHLVALMVQLRVARTMLTRDPAKATRLIGEIRGVIAGALETLLDLGSGIHPRLLTDHGLAEALRTQVANPSVRVTVDADGVRRYQAEVEAAVYFACLEALQNASKHAAGANVAVTLAEEEGTLVFTVRDDGDGFDPEQSRPGSGLGNMRDRLTALDGSLELTSAPSRGTCVTGRVPVQ
jgi:signal transduction histidine kinase